MKYDQLREKALANFESLLDLWGIEYKKITEVEYDFINPTRYDKNYGACRFNINKGRGADFASVTISESDCNNIGNGFTKEDFVGYVNGTAQKAGFDIIGLTQRIRHTNTYQDAAGWLSRDLQAIKDNGSLIVPAKDAAERRRKDQRQQQQKIVELSQRLWHAAKEIKNTKAEVYFNSRELHPQEKTIRIINYLRHKGTDKRYPTVIFKVQEALDGPIVAIHRIFLKEDGNGKADVPEPKMALGRIKGAGIWFGTPSDTLYVAEGPENALYIREVGIKFVVSTVYSTNYHNLVIPSYTKTVVLVPDEDGAGLNACKLAIKEYTKQGKNVKLVKYNGK